MAGPGYVAARAPGMRLLAAGAARARHASFELMSSSPDPDRSPPPRELERIQKRFQRRARLRLLCPASVLVSALLVGALFAVDVPRVLMMVLTLAVGAAGIYAYLQYGCPACEAVFGNRHVGRTCPECGVRLVA
jgi:hypothetical protein